MEMYLLFCNLTHLPLDTMAVISQTTQTTVSFFCYFDSMSLKFVPKGPIDNKAASFQAKPLPEPMLLHCQLDPLEQTSVTSNRNDRKNYTETNADPAHRRIYAALGGDELMVIHSMEWEGWDILRSSFDIPVIVKFGSTAETSTNIFMKQLSWNRLGSVNITILR